MTPTTNIDWTKMVGRKVRHRTHPTEITGTITKVEKVTFGGGTLIAYLDNGEAYTVSVLELIDDAPAPFKPSPYPVCPKCNTGRMVPMFLSGPACDLACEKSPVPARATRYWATLCSEVEYCLWQSKEDAEWWLTQDATTKVVQVECDFEPKFDQTAFGRPCDIVFCNDVRLTEPEDTQPISTQPWVPGQLTWKLAPNPNYAFPVSAPLAPSKP